MQALRVECSTTPADLQRWDHFVLGHPSGSVFHRPQWLQHTSTWPVQVLLAYHHQTLVGGFAFVLNARRPLRRVMPPVLTSRFAPLVSPSLAPEQRLAVYEGLLKALPAYDLIHLSTLDALSSGELKTVMQHPRHNETPTHLKAPFVDESALIASYSTQIRRQLSKAQEAGAQPIAEADPMQAYALFSGAYAIRGQQPRFTQTWFSQHLDQLRAEGMASLPGVLDASGCLVGALLLAVDPKTVYYMVSGIDREALGGNAGAMLVHTALNYASTSGKSFDFNGSSIPGINTFFEKFQGEPATVVHLKKANTTRGSLAMHVATLFKKPII